MKSGQPAINDLSSRESARSNATTKRDSPAISVSEKSGLSVECQALEFCEIPAKHWRFIIFGQSSNHKRVMIVRKESSRSCQEFAETVGYR